MSNITLKCKLNRLNIPANKSTAPLFLAIDLIPDEATDIKSPQLPLDICIVIDSSSSMSGDKLENAKKGANELVKRLSSSDYVSVFDFSDTVNEVISRVKAKDKDKIKEEIDRIYIKNSTSLFAGLQTGYHELKKSSENNSVRRIILLTDGIPTDIEGNSPQYPQIAKEMREFGISIISLGIGDGYNENLLMSLSQNSGGKWYNINTSDTIPEIFAEELSNMSITRITKPKLSIKPIPGVEIFDIMYAKPNIHRLNDVQLLDGQYNIALTDIAAGTPQTIVARVKSPINPEGPFRLAKVELLGSCEPISENILVNYTNDENLFTIENDAFPRELATLTEGTIIISEGIAKNDTLLTDEGKTKIQNLNKGTVIKDIKDRINDVNETILKATEKEAQEVLTMIKKKKE